MKTKILIIIIVLAFLEAYSVSPTLRQLRLTAVVFVTDPAGAEVIIDGKRMGITPCTITLVIGKAYDIELRKDDKVARFYNFVPRDPDK